MIVENYIPFPYGCNLNCKFCYLWRQNRLNHKNQLIINENYIKKILFLEKDLLDCDIKYKLKILWWEPTLYLELFEKLFQYISTYKYFDIILDIQIFTNWQNIESVLNTINNYSLDRKKIKFSFSLHWNKDEHDYLTWHKWSFKKLLSSYLKVKSLWYSYKICFVVNKKNLFNLRETILKLTKLWFEEITLLFVDYSWDAYTNKKELFINFIDKNIAYFIKKELIPFFIKLKDKNNIIIETNTVFPLCMYKWSPFFEEISKNYKNANNFFHLNIPWIITKRLKSPFSEKINKKIKKLKVINDNISLNDIYNIKSKNDYIKLLIKSSNIWNNLFHQISNNTHDSCKKCDLFHTCIVPHRWESKIHSHIHWINILWAWFWDVFYELWNK